MPESPNDLGQADLEQRLKAARARYQPHPAANADPSMGIAMRSGIEFVAALVVAVGIGVLIDRWLHSSPAALLILLVLGFGAGLLNVYRAMKGMSYTATYRRPEDAGQAKQTEEDQD